MHTMYTKEDHTVMIVLLCPPIPSLHSHSGLPKTPIVLLTQLGSFCCRGHRLGRASTLLGGVVRSDRPGRKRAGQRSGGESRRVFPKHGPFVS